MREIFVTLKATKIISGAFGPFLLFGCIRGVGQSTDEGQSYTLRGVPGLASEIADKKPKYRLYCASDLSSLKSPGKSQLVQEFDSIPDDGNLEISDNSKVAASSYCLIDVAVSDTTQETQFKWIGKGADGSTLKGVFYRSSAVKPSDNSLAVTLYRTYENSTSGTLDIFAKATFPANTPVKDLKEALLSCGTQTFKSTVSTPDSATATASNLTFSVSKSPLAGKVTSCTLKATIGNDSFSADSVKIEPKVTDTKVSVAVIMTKVQADLKTMTIQTTIK